MTREIMVSHVFAALTKKRTDLAEKEKGFTLIELLVTVIIIGVLAAIAIPVYLNVQGGAKDSAVKSDLTSAKTTLVTAQTQKGGGATLPATLADIGGFEQPAADNYTVAAATTGTSPTPAGDPIAYTTNGKDQFCFFAVSASGEKFAIDASSAVTQKQTCETGTGLMKPAT